MKNNRRSFISSSMLLTVVVTVCVWIFGFLYLSLNRDSEKALFLEKQTQNQKIAWEAATKIHKVGMQAYFDAYLNVPRVTTIFSQANSDNNATKSEARQKIYKLLLPLYSELQNRNVRQLQFHDKDNNSFLRFHLPHRFGDSLNSTRPSVVLANKEKKVVQGFETGRVVSGFRNVFPLSNGGKHIGSVELSQPFEAIRSELSALDSNKESLMVLRASEILPKIFEEQKKFYKKSGFSDDWLLEEEASLSIGSTSRRLCKILKYKKDFKIELEKGQSFSYEIVLSDDSATYIVTVTPMLDVDGKYAAALFSFMPSPELQAVDKNFKIHLFYFSFMLFAASSALFWLLRSRRILDDERKNIAAITSTMGEGLYVIDKEGKIKYINDSALGMLGLTKGQAIGNVAHYLFHYHKENIGCELKDCEVFKTTLTGDRYEGIEHFKKQNGEIFSVDITSSPLKDEDEIIGAITVFKDITERMRLEDNLKSLNKELNDRVESEVAKRVESDAVFKTIFNKSPEGILIISKNGTFKECNTAAAQMLGYTEIELLDKSPSDISPEIQPETGFFSETAAKMFIDGAFAGRTQNFEWVHIKKDGTEVTMEVMLSKMSRNDTEELLVLWRDITNFKKLQKEKDEQQAMLIQQSKLAEMGSMVGAIAHQWKQPLNAVWLIIQDLVMCYEYGEMTPSEMRKYKHDIGEQINFMTQTIEDFRGFYKPSKSAETFQILKAVQAVLSLLKNQLNNENILLSLEIDDTFCVRGFESEFKQVILNIVNNAMDALLERGVEQRELRITASAVNNNKIILRISDNAGGINEELLRDGKIFEPYSTTKGEKGTGVGLSLSKIIIERSMGGTLRAQNIDGGAEFSIELLRF